MDEFEIIRRYFDRPTPDCNVRIGIGDDGAVFSPPDGKDLVTVVDTLVAGVHFPPGLDAADIGYRSVAVNLSDIAAMGGCPRWMTLALTLPSAQANENWLTSFSAGLFECAEHAGVSLLGGDTTSGPELVSTVQIIGTVDPGTAISRGGARDGDLIFVTGAPGDAAAGLHVLQHGNDGDAMQDTLTERFRRPQARTEFGQKLASLATAAIDVSDGLYGDLLKLLQSSGVAGQIELTSLPLSQAIRRLFDRDKCLQFALSGGDDYELCFTAAPQSRDSVVDLGASVDVEVSEIGIVCAGEGLRCLNKGEPSDFAHGGYRHFVAGGAR
jgi:thiamine-monophosphate kinase